MAYILTNLIDTFGKTNIEAYQIISSYNIDVEKKEVTVILKTFTSKEAKIDGYKHLTTSKRVFKGDDYEHIFGENSAIPLLTTRQGDNLKAIYEMLDETEEFQLDEKRSTSYEDIIEHEDTGEDEGSDETSDEDSDEGADEGADEDTEFILGCTDPSALNYNPEATLEDGSCIYEEEGEG